MAADKYNYKKLVRDLNGGDDDIAIFALRTIIKVERGKLGREEEAIEILIETINSLMSSWPSEIKFYGQRAIEHLNTLKAPDEPELDENIEEAPIDLDDLDDEDIRKVIHCLKKIEAQKYDDADKKVRSMLEGARDPLLIAALLAALGAVGSSSDLFLVKQFTTHTNGRVRATCVDTIKCLAEAPEVAIGMIESFLKDRDGSAKARAIKFIGSHQIEKVEAAIDEMLQSDSVSDRTNLAEAICTITNDKVVPFLKRISEDPDETVRLKVLETIEREEHPQKAFILKKMVKDSSPTVLKVAKEALRRYETKRMLSIGGFQSMIPDDAPAHRKMKNLEEIQNEEELDPINLDDLRDPNPDVKLQCLQKIRQRTFERGYKQVVEVLGVAENVEILTEALRCLTVIGTSKDVEAIMHFVNHVEAPVRAAAAEAIEQLANKTQIIFLLLPMVHDEAPEVRHVAARAITRFDRESILGAVAKMSAHPAKAIRYRLFQYLSNYTGHAVMGYFSRGYSDKAAAIRRVTAQAMYLQEDERAKKILEALSKDPDERVKTEASRVLLALGRKREGTEATKLPDLNKAYEVAKQIMGQALIEIEEQTKEAERAQFAAASKRGELERSSVKAFVGKVSSDLNSKKELEMLELNKNVIMGDMGRKIYKMILRKQVNHKKYDRVVFLIKKFKHLEQQGPGKQDEEKGFWAKIQDMAGVEKEDEHLKKIKEKLNQQYIELGRVAFQLSYTENVLYQDLHMEYIELEAVVKRIAEKREEMGLPKKEA